MMRTFDVTLSLVLLIFVIPFLIPIVIILRFTGEGEVFYCQSRVGRYGRRFKIIKFATMLKNSPNLGAGSITVRNDPRVLPFGKFLRRTKINEIPQLINVLTGHMSFIGPRPHVERDLKGLNQEQLKIILSMQPGITGIGSLVFRNEERIIHDQVDGRSFYDEQIAPYKADLEAWYFEHKNLVINFKILLLTIYVVMGVKSQKIFYHFAKLPPVPNELKKYFYE